MPAPERQPEPTSGPTSATNPRRPRSQVIARRVAVPVLLVAVLVPYVIAAGALWSRTAAELDAARSERAGIVAVRALAGLVAATADVQSQAVAGQEPDAITLRAAMVAMDAADARVGIRLGTDRRWASVRSRLSSELTSNARGGDAYTRWSQVVDLEMAIVSAVADGSGLRLDPAVDSHYLSASVVQTVPELVIGAGRVSDLTLLLEQGKAPVASGTLAVTLQRFELDETAADLDEGLRKGFQNTTSRTLGPGLLGELDQLRDAVTELAPPLSAIGSAPVTPSAAAAQSARQQVRASALGTHTAALRELDALLATRESDISATRRLVVLAGGAGLALALAVAWFAAPRRRLVTGRDVDADLAAETPDGATPATPPTPATSARPAARSAAEAPADDASDDLLEARQLVHVGRAVARRDAPPGEEDR